MTKKEFNKIMTEFLSLKEDSENLNKAFKKLNPDFNYWSLGRVETLFIDTLKIAMDDKYDWISYWFYDCDCGKNKMGVKDKDGKEIPLKTINNLYDLIKGDY